MRRALQVVVALCSLVPMLAGAAGVWGGQVLVGQGLTVIGVGDSLNDPDSHFRYLSGLLLGIGLAYAASVPGIERHRGRFLLLGFIVMVGGLGRLLSLVLDGPPSAVMLFALLMELVVTPLLTFWQWRVSREG